jgi:uncharacterized lipoprotein YbaY
MRSRLVAITLGLYLSFALAGCNSNKPSDTAGTDTSSPTSTPSGSTPPSSSSAPAGGSAMSSKAEARQPVVLPTGTTLTVRLRDAVGSKISQPGQAFSATLASAVEVDGRDVIPAGATASGVVVDAAPLGRFKGGARLQLKLTSINVKGTDKAIQTSSIERTEKGKGKRTAVMAGGGAAVGALIGGLAGGGKGAAIGALAGGGAGTGGAAFTGNKDIVLPAESALSFRLEQPLELR